METCSRSMCDEFWSRWRKEVYATPQAQQEWNQVKRNFQVGDMFWYVTMLFGMYGQWHEY